MPSVKYNQFAKSVQAMEVTLLNVKENAARREALTQEMADLRQVYEDLVRNLKSLKQLKMIITLAMNKYRKSIKELVEQEIESALELVFPDEHYQVRIDLSTRDGAPSAVLKVGSMVNGKLYWGAPKNKNGGLAKQVITIASVTCILRLMGSPTVLVDEAFNSGDNKSLKEMEPLLQKLYDLGMQFIGVEHRPDVYSGITHRVLSMHKNRRARTVEVVEIRNVSPGELSGLKEIMTNLQSSESLPQLQLPLKEQVLGEVVAAGIGFELENSVSNLLDGEFSEEAFSALMGESEIEAPLDIKSESIPVQETQASVMSEPLNMSQTVHQNVADVANIPVISVKPESSVKHEVETTIPTPTSLPTQEDFESLLSDLE